MIDRPDVLEEARAKLGLALEDLWLRYFALGGMCTVMELEAILCGALIGTDIERDRVAVALNERFSELGGDHPVPYTSDNAAQDFGTTEAEVP